MADLSEWKKGSHGVAFMVAFGESFQVVGAFNSSPWTIRNVGADEDKARSAKQFITLAIANNMFAYGLVGTMLTGSPAPLIGTLLANAQIIAVYYYAIKQAQSNGDVGNGWFK